MIKKCDCYRVKKVERSCISQITGMPFWYDSELPYCIGTKEQDECSCGGDRHKCDFYPEVREKARNEQKNNMTKNSDDCLIVTYDYCYPDVPTLCIAREEKDKVMVLNTIQGDEALAGYAWLTGFATLKERSKSKKKRKYYRKCGVCGDRYEQSEMLRTDNSPNGWLCLDCHNTKHPEYEDFGEY